MRTLPHSHFASWVLAKYSNPVDHQFPLYEAGYTGLNTHLGNQQNNLEMLIYKCAFVLSLRLELLGLNFMWIFFGFPGDNSVLV